MNKLYKHILALLCVIAMVAGMVPAAFAEGEESADFVVLSTTDIHGKCWDTNVLTDGNESNNLLRAATAVSQIREAYGDNVVLVDNGDLYQGTPISSYNISQLTLGNTTDPNPMAVCLGYMGYDAAVMGNHEFNYAWDTMQSIRSYLNEQGVPSICANLYYAETGENVFTPYVTKDITVADKTLKIGILGLENTDCPRWDVPDNYPGIVFAHPDNTFMSMAWEVERYVPQMKSEGCDFIIVSYHSGLGSTSGDLEFGVNTENQVLRLISETTGIDMVIAGHDHSSGYSNNEYENKDGEKVLVVNGGGTQLTQSVWTATVDADGNFSISKKDSKNLSLGGYTADPVLKEMIRPYADAASAYVNQVCGKAIGTWDGKTNYYLTQTDTMDMINRAQIFSGNFHLAEKFATDEAKAELFEKTGLDHITIDLSSTSAVSTRAVSAGEVSMKNIYQYYRYDNTLYVLPMSGQQIKDALEFNAATHLKATVRNGSVSYSTIGDNFTNPIFYGLDFDYDMYQPEGSRVIISQFADGRAFNLDKMYLVAVNNYHLGNASGCFKDYTTDMAVWSQTDDLGGGVVQDMIKEFFEEETSANGGVSPEKSNWKLTYSGDPSEIVEVNLTGDIYGKLVNKFEDGDHVLLYFYDGTTCISAASNGGKLQAAEAKSGGNMVAATKDAAVFTVQAEGESFYLITNGKYLTSGATGNSLTLEETPNVCSLWHSEEVDGGVHIMNDGAEYNGVKNQALEWYSGFTTYGVKDTSAYLFGIYSVTDCAVYSPAGIEDGGKYLIYYDDGGTIVSSTSNGNKLDGIAAQKDSGLIPMTEDLTVFTAVAEGNNFYLVADGKYLTSGESGNSLTMEEAPNEFSLWYLKAVEGGYHVMSANAAYNGSKNQALEWFNGFTTYGEKDTPIYLFNFYSVAKSDSDSCENGHAWGEWKVTTEPTCTKEGEETRTCTRCGETETRTVAALGHDYVATVTEPTCTEKGFTMHKCSRCDDEFVDTYTDALGHDWGEWEVTKEATEEEAGEEACTCKRCEETQTREIAKLDCPSAKFVDVDQSKWYHSAIDYAIVHSLFSGVSDTQFAPNKATTRAMFVAVLWRMDGNPEPKSSADFADVPETSYYTKAVAWAAENKIVAGKSNNHFAPLDDVTREQAAAFLYRYAKYKNFDLTADADLTAYPDANKVSNYAKESLSWAVGHELISGNKSGDVINLDPAGLATRAQVARILMLFAENIAK